MTFNTVKEIIEKTALKDVVSFVPGSDLFDIDVSAKEFEGTIPDALGTTEFTEVIEIPANIYKRDGMVEVYKSNLVAQLYRELSVAIYSGKDANIKSIDSQSVQLKADSFSKAYDALVASDIIAGVTLFNAQNAIELGYSKDLMNNLYHGTINDTNDTSILALSISQGSYNLWLSDVEWEEEFDAEHNKHYLRGTIYAQGAPTLPSVVVKKG